MASQVHPTLSPVVHPAAMRGMTIAAVIPSYKVKPHVLSVIAQVGPEVTRIYVVDDCCPEQSGKFVVENCSDPRVKVIFNPKNLGVGGATMAGYRQALEDGCDIAVKLDGDGQMDPSLISTFIKPIQEGEADYTKGNRFFSLESLERMPRLRLFGNAILSFVNKASSGYWDVMDPTNGYTAIHRSAMSLLPLHKIDRGYFFESDMLFRLNTVRAVIREIPMDAVYADERSNLRIGKVLREFPRKYLVRFFKRIFYNYFLRDFNVCSIQLLSGLLLLLFGVSYGSYHWYQSAISQSTTAAGTVMVAVLPIMIATQLLISTVTLDIMNVPRNPLQRSYRSASKRVVQNHNS